MDSRHRGRGTPKGGLSKKAQQEEDVWITPEAAGQVQTKEEAPDPNLWNLANFLKQIHKDFCPIVTKVRVICMMLH